MYAENEAGRLVRDLFLFLKKAQDEVKASGMQFSFNIFRQPSTWTYNKNKLYKTLDYRFRDMLNFYFSEKALGLVSPPHFAYDFSRKLFHMFHYLTKFHCLIAFTSRDIW